MRFDGSDDDGYDALKEWIAFVLQPVAANADSGPLYMDLEHMLSLAAGMLRFSPYDGDWLTSLNPQPMTKSRSSEWTLMSRLS